MLLMTYNIRSLRDDRHAVARVIAAADPDVVCIQEAPRFLFWRRKCRWLAGAVGMRIAVGGRSAAANLIMVRPSVEVLATRTALFTKDPRLHQRGAAYALMVVAGTPAVVVGTHLDGYPEPRLRHVGELRDVLDDFRPGEVGSPGVGVGVGVVLAGDMNDDPGSAVWQALQEVGVDAFGTAGSGDGFTLNVTNPTRRIDALFISAPLQVRSAREIDSADVRIASDHRPVLADLSEESGAD